MIKIFHSFYLAKWISFSWLVSLFFFFILIYLIFLWSFMEINSFSYQHFVCIGLNSTFLEFSSKLLTARLTHFLHGYQVTTTWRLFLDIRQGKCVFKELGAYSEKSNDSVPFLDLKPQEAFYLDYQKLLKIFSNLS